jgi:hypothetical protein
MSHFNLECCWHWECIVVLRVIKHFFTSTGISGFENKNYVMHRVRKVKEKSDRLCAIVVRVLGYRSGGPGSIPGTTKKK